VSFNFTNSLICGIVSSRALDHPALKRRIATRVRRSRTSGHALDLNQSKVGGQPQAFRSSIFSRKFALLIAIDLVAPSYQLLDFSLATRPADFLLDFADSSTCERDAAGAFSLNNGAPIDGVRSSQSRFLRMKSPSSGEHSFMDFGLGPIDLVVSCVPECIRGLPHSLRPTGLRPASWPASGGAFSFERHQDR